MNPLLCNPDSGICEMPAQDTIHPDNATVKVQQKPVKVIYFTDPICSSCWGIEPQLRKLKLEYGNEVELEYRMGGLLPDWSYNSGGISKPSDVAQHWDEVSSYYDMPIDGDLWLEDPLSSSYPPSIAFKAVQMQDPAKAIAFMREIREMVFLKKKNIARWENLHQAAKNVDVDLVRFKKDYEGDAQKLFKDDLQYARTLGVRGFPTLFFTDQTGRQEIVFGSKPYEAMEQTLRKLHPSASKNSYQHSWEFLFSKYPTLTAKEFSVLTGKERKASETLLDELVEQGHLHKLKTKNGALWSVIRKK